VNDKFNVSLRIDSPFEGGPVKFTGNGTLQYPKNVYWSVNTLLTKPEKKDLDYTVNGRIHFVFPSHTTTMFFDQTKENSSQLGLLWSQKLSDSMKFATKFTLDSNLKVDPVFEAAIESKVDSDNTVKSKAHFSTNKETNVTNLRLLMAYTSKVSKMCSITVGADINAFEFMGNKGGDGHSLGFEVKLK